MVPLFMMIIYLSYGSVSVILYVRVIYVFITNPYFKPTIYRIFTLLGVMDISNYTLNVWLFRLSMCPPFFFIFEWLNTTNSRVISVQMFATFYATYAQYLLHLVITVNRYTAVAQPVKYKGRWKKCFRRIMLGVFLLGLLPSWNLIFSTTAFLPINPKNPSEGYAFSPTPPLLVVSVGFALVCLAFNVRTFLLIFHFKTRSVSVADTKMNVYRASSSNNGMAGNGKRSSPPPQSAAATISDSKGSSLSQKQKAEVNLFLISFAMMIFQCLNASYHVTNIFVKYLGRAETLAVLYAQLPWVSDINNLHSAWLLFLLSPRLRESVFPASWTLRCRQYDLFCLPAILGIASAVPTSSSTPVKPFTTTANAVTVAGLPNGVSKNGSFTIFTKAIVASPVSKSVPRY